MRLASFLSEGLRTKPLDMKTLQEPQPGVDERERKKRKVQEERRKEASRQGVGFGGEKGEIKEGRKSLGGREKAYQSHTRTAGGLLRGAARFYWGYGFLAGGLRVSSLKGCAVHGRC